MSRIYINNDWLFKENDESSYQKIRIPHTCKEVPLHYFDESEYEMIAQYRRHIYAPVEWKNQHVLITFEGVGHSCKVYCNEHFVGSHHCGYTACTFDLSPYLLFGKDNMIQVEIDSRETQNIPPFGFVIDYMTFGGIYRDVYLDIRSDIYIKDVKYHSIGTEMVDLHIDVTLSDACTNYTIEKKLILDEDIIHLQSQHSLSSTDHLKLKCWDIEHPVLYKLEVDLVIEDKVVDRYKTTVGIRDIAFLADGFYLNGKKIKIRGLNRHQSYPYVGYAMPESMQRYDAKLLKELGCNAVRTSHYPQSHDFIDECDRLGLLVFMEIPGWQHIGDNEWKQQTLKNVEDMITQYRNHPSIFIWGVRINESQDDEAFYHATNAIARSLDNRPTGGVRAHKNSQMFEDVYTYNDFVHCGSNQGCLTKKEVTSDMSKAYLVTEYNGHMFPTKSYDCEEHRRDHFLRHCRVLEDISKEEDIAGSFGWCMFDYHTHKDFGSGDRICYHGVMDMFRNPKLAAYAYALYGKKPILALTSSMDIGEHPGCNRGPTYIITNADSVRMYKNDKFIKEYRKEESIYSYLHSVILVDDFIGDEIIKNENFKPRQAQIIKDALNHVAVYGYNVLPKKIILSMLELIVFYRMNPQDAVSYYNKYIGDWGGQSTTYRFEAIKDGQVIETLIKEPMKDMHLKFNVSHHQLKEGKSYDVASIRILACDQNENILPFYHEPLQVEVSGVLELIGSSILSLHGGMGGLYVKTTGQSGKAAVNIKDHIGHSYTIEFEVIKEGEE